jgi:hypothetical protein
MPDSPSSMKRFKGVCGRWSSRNVDTFKVLWEDEMQERLLVAATTQD